LNLASALIYRVLESDDFDTWSNVRKRYLPNEHHTLFDVISKHADKFHKLPTIEELKLEVRDAATIDKVYALESIETEADAYFLLEAVKSEYAQREALFQMDKWVDASMAFETAEEVVRHIQQIGVDLEMKVELTPPEESMQRISLFESEEEMEGRITLGLNRDFDSRFSFLPTDLIMVGGYRGTGKSLVCSNVCHNVVEVKKKKALYFSIEMLPREVLQRACSIATGVPFFKIKSKKLDNVEWEKVVKWWSNRYVEGVADYEAYLDHRSFEKFHSMVSRKQLVEANLDVIYDPGLTLSRINAEIDKRIALGEEIGLVAVDYVNKVSRVGGGFGLDTLDWKEQILVSNGLKRIAQDRKVPMLSPYQTKEDGSVRFGQGLLDSCDAALTLKAHKGDNPGMTFVTTKMRSASDDEQFTSKVDWGTLVIGPDSVQPPQEEQKPMKGGFGISNNNRIQEQSGNIYDD